MISNLYNEQLSGHFTILEITANDRCCPHPLVYLRSTSVDFIMWSLSIVIPSGFGLGLFSNDHKFTHSLNEVVSLGRINVLQAESLVFSMDRLILRRSSQRSWIPLAWDQGVGFDVGSCPPSICLGRYRSLVVGSNSCRAWYAGLLVQALFLR